MTTGTTTRATITGTIQNACAIIEAGQRLYEKLDALPWVPSGLWRLCTRIQELGEALEAFAARIGVDIDEAVLAPLFARAYRA